MAYHDLDGSNNGSQYRPAEGVDIESCTDAGGGFNVGWLNPGEWMEYTVEVPAAGTYSLEARAPTGQTPRESTRLSTPSISRRV